MNLLIVILTVIGLVIVLPLGASILMALILETANNEGLYDDED